MNGKKTIEVRKGTALYKAIKKLIDEYGYADIYVYCTKDGELFYDPITKKWFATKSRNIKKYHRLSNGVVKFKFRCYKVEEIKYIGIDNYYGTHLLGEPVLEKASCLFHKELENYLGGNRNSNDVCSVGTAIHISDLEIFDKPKELSEFKKYVEYLPDILCLNCENYWEDESGLPIEPKCELHWKNCNKRKITKAPQSWCYVEV